MILLAAARAADPESWSALHDALLVEAADGTPEVAVRFYEELLGDLAANDPMRGSVAYALGRARLVTGNVDGALAALRLAMKDPTVKPAAGVLLSVIEQQRRTVPMLPAVWTFHDDTGPWVRGWQGRDEGELGNDQVGGDHALLWPGTVRGGDVDELALGLAPGVTPSSIRFRARADVFPMELRLACTDGSGGRFLGPTFTVPVGEWVDISAAVSGFRRSQAPASQGPAAVRSLVVEELTGVLTEHRGAFRLWIDDLELR